MTRAITVQISASELIDKLTILDLRLDRISDPDKRANVVSEHALLLATYEASIPKSQHALALKTKLREVNETLWDIENEIRDCERDRDFGPRPVARLHPLSGAHHRPRFTSRADTVYSDPDVVTSMPLEDRRIRYAPNLHVLVADKGLFIKARGRDADRFDVCRGGARSRLWLGLRYA